MDEHDLSELLGNILDNARKWARSEVLVKGEILPGNRKSFLRTMTGPACQKISVKTFLTGETGWMLRRPVTGLD